MTESSTESVVLDSNVWIYALLLDVSASDRTRVAQSVRAHPNVLVSVQIINEVCVTLRRKAKFSDDQLDALIRGFYASHQVVGSDEESLLLACKLRTSYSLSYWDS